MSGNSSTDMSVSLHGKTDFRDLQESNGFFNVIGDTTRVMCITSTIIDLMITNEGERVLHLVFCVLT